MISKPRITRPTISPPVQIMIVCLAQPVNINAVNKAAIKDNTFFMINHFLFENHLR